MGVLLLCCESCRHWGGEHSAHPGPAPGSMRICEKGRETHRHSWKTCWMPRTREQEAEAAHGAGKLF